MPDIELQITIRGLGTAAQLRKIRMIVGQSGFQSATDGNSILSFDIRSKRIANRIGQRCATLPFVESWQCGYTNDAGEQTVEAHLLARKHLTRVCIVIEGGNVQDVFADGPIEYLVKDFDNIKGGDPFEAEFSDANLLADRESFDTAVHADTSPTNPL